MDKSYEKSFAEFIEVNEQKAINTLSRRYSVLAEEDIKNIIYAKNNMATLLFYCL